MAGRGSAPMRPEQRSPRAKGDPVALRVLPSVQAEQPDLPDFQIEVDGELVSFSWPAQTRTWWQMWADSPLSSEFTSTDWSELLDTALLHARFWRGDHKVAAELRLRVSKHGATAEDRMRLRITFAQAQEAEAKAPQGKASARDRRGPLTSVPASAQ
jgi:hypothetical protein